ncbi:MAG: LPS export ABC transporter periplasmic protein LptC [Mucinivorans sp.]
MRYLLLCLFFLSSCGNKVVPSELDPETTPTLTSYDHTMVYSGSGRKRYKVVAALIKRYEMAKEPFFEYPEGIHVETFGDSLAIESDLRADWAHYNEKTKIWEARGNVVAHNYDGNRELYTDQLFWDEGKGLIYTPKRAKVIDGGSMHVGTGFEADQSFESWQFNRTSGQIEVQQQPDTVVVDSVAMDSVQIKK